MVEDDDVKLLFGEQARLFVADIMPPTWWRPNLSKRFMLFNTYGGYEMLLTYWFNVKQNMLLRKSGAHHKWLQLRQTRCQRLLLRQYREIMGYA
jgi:hypothetical protein